MTHEPLVDQAAAEAEMQELMAAQAELSALRTQAIADAAEIEQLRAENERLKVGHDRYEIVRKLNVVQFQKLYTKALQSHLPFDNLVDILGGCNRE